MRRSTTPCKPLWSKSMARVQPLLATKVWLFLDGFCMFLSHQPQPSLSIQMIGPWLRWICTKHPGRVGFPMGGWQLNQLTSSVVHRGFQCLNVSIYCRGHPQSFHHSIIPLSTLIPPRRTTRACKPWLMPSKMLAPLARLRLEWFSLTCQLEWLKQLVSCCVLWCLFFLESVQKMFVEI